MGMGQCKNAERTVARDSLPSFPVEGTNVEAAARKSTETQISKKAIAAGTKRVVNAWSM
jgi:hypothetical protein